MKCGYKQDDLLLIYFLITFTDLSLIKHVLLHLLCELPELFLVSLDILHKSVVSIQNQQSVECEVVAEVDLGVRVELLLSLLHLVEREDVLQVLERLHLARVLQLVVEGEDHGRDREPGGLELTELGLIDVRYWLL
jgi:hypothetical protein